ESVIAHAPENTYLLILPPGAENLVADGAGVAKISPRVKYYSVREQIALPRILRRHQIDLFHSPHFLLPLVRPCPVVATIHDVIYLACKGDLPSPVGRLYYRVMMKSALRRAAKIITDSEFSRNDIVARLHASPEKIHVIYPGVDPLFQRVSAAAQIEGTLSRYGIAGDCVLYTGIYKLRKNHAGLLRAFKTFLEKGTTARLVIAGPMGEGEPVLRRLAGELGIADKVIFTGFVPDCDLPALYSAAKVYACPSLYEGFGFTVLEAMACGTPVVSSAATSLPEVGGDAALYADSQQPEQFAQALHRAFSDSALRSDMIEKGHKNVARFSWSNTAAQTLAVYQAAIHNSPRKIA
ncbi:MAG TPA: glycosyltransferase family 1 protein, partial [Candidatus Angelobacter sp.]|nr:glycosyltransferase family 1 protein [Candidatus Angelobacter sp.]